MHVAVSVYMLCSFSLLPHRSRSAVEGNAKIHKRHPRFPRSPTTAAAVAVVAVVVAKTPSHQSLPTTTLAKTVLYDTLTSLSLIRSATVIVITPHTHATTSQPAAAAPQRVVICELAGRRQADRPTHTTNTLAQTE